MSDTTQAGLTSLQQRSGKTADDSFDLALPRVLAARTGRVVVKKADVRRHRTPLKKFEPFVVDVVDKPKDNLAAAAEALVAKIAQHRQHGVQGVLVLPRGTQEWRFAKTIADAAREGVFVRVSKLPDLRAGAQRILSQLLKDSQLARAHINAYSASMRAGLKRPNSTE